MIASQRQTKKNRYLLLGLHDKNALFCYLLTPMAFGRFFLLIFVISFHTHTTKDTNVITSV